MAKQSVQKETCGGCAINDIKPPKWTAETPMLNLIFSFEDALKLQAGIAEAIQRMNRCDQRKVSPALTLAVHLNTHRISVHNWPDISK